MKISEKELEDFLFENLKSEKYCELKNIGLWYNNIFNGMRFYRQVFLDYYGRADIVGFSIGPISSITNRRPASVVIIELKEGEVSESTYLQALKYKNAISYCMDDFDLHFSIITIGSSISKTFSNILDKLPDDIIHFDYKLSLSGISFEVFRPKYLGVYFEELSDDDMDRFISKGRKIENILQECTLIADQEYKIQYNEEN